MKSRIVYKVVRVAGKKKPRYYSFLAVRHDQVHYFRSRFVCGKYGSPLFAFATETQARTFGGRLAGYRLMFGVNPCRWEVWLAEAAGAVHTPCGEERGGNLRGWKGWTRKQGRERHTGWPEGTLLCQRIRLIKCVAGVP